MRVLFAGSPEIAVPALKAIASSRHSVVGVLTNPEAKVGRGLRLSDTPVASAAKALWGNDTPIFTFESLKTEAREAIAARVPDILVSFAYGRIFGPKFMSIFPRGGINVHPSLLPRWRGSSPIQHAILARDAETGISVQLLAPEMDTGAILLARRFQLNGKETARTLSEFCAEAAAPIVVEALNAIEEGKAHPLPQRGEPTYCGKIAKEDGKIDWTSASLEIDAKMRAFDPWPGSFTFFRQTRLSILEAEPADDFIADIGAEHVTNSPPGTIIAVSAQRGIIMATGRGYIAVKRLQLATRKASGYRDFANGVRELIGTVLE